MADIFKPRKTPKHLIIDEQHAYRRKPRGSMLKWILWFVGFLLATGLALEFRFLNVI